MNTKDKTIFIFLIGKIKNLNDEISLLKAEREMLLELPGTPWLKEPFCAWSNDRSILPVFLFCLIK